MCGASPANLSRGPLRLVDLGTELIEITRNDTGLAALKRQAWARPIPDEGHANTVAVEQLGVGQSLAGLLVDGVQGTSYVGANLRLHETRGLLIEIPFEAYDETGQFTHVRKWFDSHTPPENLLFRSTDGPILLFGLRWSGHSYPSGLAAGLGTIRVGEAVLNSRDGALTDPLLVKQLRSWLDRLNQWTGLTTVSKEVTSDPDGRVSRARRYTVIVESVEAVTWQQDDATLALETTWRSAEENDHLGRRHVIADDVVLESSFPEARSFDDHLVEQRKVANLLVLLYGSQVSFRRHRLRDERFVERFSSGETIDTPFVDVISGRTVRDWAQPMPASTERPIAFLTQIGPDGLATWAANYDPWKRFVLPAANAFGRRDVLVEETVMSTSTSLEAAGQLIGIRDNEETTYGRNGRPTTATHVYRCLHLLGITWPEHIDGIEGLARAIADNYNTIKHADRGGFPDARHSILVSHINRWIVRLLALHLTGKGDDLLKDYRSSTSNELWVLRQYFDGYELGIDAQGAWHTRIPQER